MSSNYPPGVTGFEPQIAGYPEREAVRSVVCGYESTGSFSDGIPLDWECTFEGDVPGTLYGDPRDSVTFIWDCPECKHERETDVPLDEFEPDPDDERDRAMEL